MIFRRRTCVTGRAGRVKCGNSRSEVSMKDDQRAWPPRLEMASQRGMKRVHVIQRRVTPDLQPPDPTPPSVLTAKFMCSWNLTKSELSFLSYYAELLLHSSTGSLAHVA